MRISDWSSDVCSSDLLFGVLVLSFTAAVSGGIARDLLIGATPPAAIANWHYLAVSCIAGLATFYRGSLIERMRNPVQLSSEERRVGKESVSTGRCRWSQDH